MPVASDFQLIKPKLAIWSAWCSHSRVDLFSTAIALPGDGGLVLIDPIRLAEDAIVALTDQFGAPKSILLTSSNHERDSSWFTQKFQVNRVLTHPDACPFLKVPAQSLLLEGVTPLPGLRILELPGAAPGEIGIFIEENGTLILGDILINLDNFGFAILPDKYATSRRQLRQSVQKIASLVPSPNALVFAHGPPILTHVAARLANLASQIQT